MGLLSTLLQPVGAIAGKVFGGGSVPDNSSAALNTSGSYYGLNSSTGNSPLIQSGFTTTQLLIVGAVVLGGLFLWKRK